MNIRWLEDFGLRFLILEIPLFEDFHCHLIKSPFFSIDVAYSAKNLKK